MPPADATSVERFVPSVDAYAALAAIYNAANPEDMRPETFYRALDRERPADHFFRRYLLRVAGEPAGFGELGVHPVQPRPGHYDLFFVVVPSFDDTQPAGLTTTFYRHLCAALAPQQPERIITESRSDRQAQVAFLAREGFRIVQREPRSRLDLTAFDPAAFAPQLAAVTAPGIRLSPLSTLQREDPDWEEKLYAVDWAYRQDMPSPYPRVREPLAQWRRRLRRPWFRADGVFVARDDRAGGLYVGSSGIAIIPSQPWRGWTTTTGVRRAYRRRGIARALKVETLRWARDQGVTEVVTGNEAANPMLALNLQLGFRPQFEQLVLEKRLPPTTR